MQVRRRRCGLISWQITSVRLNLSIFQTNLDLKYNLRHNIQDQFLLRWYNEWVSHTHAAKDTMKQRLSFKSYHSRLKLFCNQCLCHRLTEPNPFQSLCVFNWLWSIHTSIKTSASTTTSTAAKTTAASTTTSTTTKTTAASTKLCEEAERHPADSKFKLHRLPNFDEWSPNWKITPWG